jgi:hypothetical protein
LSLFQRLIDDAEGSAASVAAAQQPRWGRTAALRQYRIGALGLIWPSGAAFGTWRIRETWASSRSSPFCTVVSGFDPPDGSESLLTELVSAVILNASPERVRL